jgi:DNA-binding MarR family transcriptional regulator
MPMVVHSAPRDAPETSNDVGLKLDEFLPYRLTVLSSLVSQAVSQSQFGGGIGVSEWRILVTLGQFGVMTAKAVGIHSQMHKTKVSRAVAELEQRQLVARRTNRSDLRESLLSLTQSGHALYEALAPGALAFAAQLEDAIDPDDRAAFERTIRRLTERLRVLVAEAAKTNPPE